MLRSICLLSVWGLAIADATAAPIPPPKRPVVEVVLCVDATRDMASALACLRKSFGTLCDHWRRGPGRPVLRVGVVAYRDRGDEFVTRTVELTDDLRSVQLALNGLAADGGGDAHESVNEALHVAVCQLGWSGDTRTARFVFLLGSAPPHTDYEDDVPFPMTCSAAVDRGITIHALQVGDDAECADCWQDIAHRTGGRYVHLPNGLLSPSLLPLLPLHERSR